MRGPSFQKMSREPLRWHNVLRLSQESKGAEGFSACCFHLHWDSFGARSLILDFFFPGPTSSHYPSVLPWRMPEVSISLWNRKMPWRSWESAVVKTSETEGTEWSQVEVSGEELASCFPILENQPEMERMVWAPLTPQRHGLTQNRCTTFQALTGAGGEGHSGKQERQEITIHSSGLKV